MRRTLLLPVAGLVLVVGFGLAGCGTGSPTPTPSASDSASPSATPEDAGPTDSPTTVEPLPGSALLRVSVTADAGDQEVRLVLTFDRAAIAGNAAEEFAAIQESCPNAIASQLEIHAGLQPTGVITSHLTATGDWPDGLSFAVSAGGVIASIGDGRNVAPTDDPPGLFGCTVPIVTGPGGASFASLLLGDPAVTDRDDLEAETGQGVFGFESDSGSIPVQWRDCVIQLSSVAERLARDSGWTRPAEFGDGCLIGDAGAV